MIVLAPDADAAIMATGGFADVWNRQSRESSSY
jgi:hypothetical protein